MRVKVIDADTSEQITATSYVLDDMSTYKIRVPNRR